MKKDVLCGWVSLWDINITIKFSVKKRGLNKLLGYFNAFLAVVRRVKYYLITTMDDDSVYEDGSGTSATCEHAADANPKCRCFPISFARLLMKKSHSSSIFLAISCMARSPQPPSYHRVAVHAELMTGDGRMFRRFYCPRCSETGPPDDVIVSV